MVRLAGIIGTENWRRGRAMNKGMKERLALYKEKKPYREEPKREKKEKL